MKLHHIALAIALTVGGFNASAQGSIKNPITRAVLAVYEEELAENPKDYNVLLSRADEYYRHNEYIRALDDVNKALEYAPGEETEVRLRAYILRAGIYDQTSRHNEALSDLNSALALAPDTYSVLYQKANTEYTLGMYSEAKADFSRLIRLNSRRPEPYIGLARVAVKENNLGTANELLVTAVNIDPNNSDIYVRRSNVRKLMGDHNGAVDDLVLALSVDNTNQKAMTGLIEYGNTNYPAAMAGLSNAVQQAPQVGMYRYIRAVIAQAHCHYLAAIRDFQEILDKGIYNYHGIYASIAECNYCLGNYKEALDFIDRALNMVRDDAAHFVLRSKILRAMHQDDEAVKAAASALAIDRQSNDALMEMAMAYIALKNYDEASNLLGEAILNDAENPTYYMMRAWLFETYLNKQTIAQQLYTQVAEMSHFYIDNPRSFKGFAQLFLGETDKATRWMNNILDTVDDTDGYINYVGACFFAQSGDMDKAMKCAEKALSLGYANYHLWTENVDGKMTVAPLRDDLTFLNMLHRHDTIFGKE